MRRTCKKNVDLKWLGTALVEVGIDFTKSTYGLVQEENYSVPSLELEDSTVHIFRGGKILSLKEIEKLIEIEMYQELEKEIEQMEEALIEEASCA